MKEVCETVLSYVRTIGPEIGIHPELFANNDIHINSPESVFPKDEPSVDLETALCIISAICHLRIRNAPRTAKTARRGSSATWEDVSLRHGGED